MGFMLLSLPGGMRDRVGVGGCGVVVVARSSFIISVVSLPSSCLGACAATEYSTSCAVLCISRC